MAKVTSKQSISNKPKFIGILLCSFAIIILIGIIKSVPKSNTANCNCEIKDEYGRKKRIHVNPRDCIDFYQGELLWDGANCDVNN